MYPAIMTNSSNPFAHHTIGTRVPGLIDEVLERNPQFSGAVREGLRRLRSDLEEDRPIIPLEEAAWDYQMWESTWKMLEGRSWLNAPWFQAETFLYRKLIQIVRFWELGQDPFWPIKEEELSSNNLRDTIRLGFELESSAEERIAALLALSLWGNRMDLSYKASMALGSGSADKDDLIINNAFSAAGDIAGGAGPVHLVTDNAGAELAADLVLADYLINDLRIPVWFHVKLFPTYISDATAEDVRRHITAIKGLEDTDAAACGTRLEQHLHQGTFRVLPHLFWNSPFFLDAAPSALLEVLKKGRITIFKGDMNYRRCVHDRLYPPDYPFKDATSYFDHPMLMVRTLKSDVITGLTGEKARELDRVEPAWRNNGRRGIIQYNHG